jgi:tetratricopeptide (TPR) repeat protein
VTEDTDAAVLAYESVLDEYPNDGIAGNNLAVLYGETGDQDKAVELYLRAIHWGRAPAVSFTNAIFALYGLGRLDSALAVLDTFRVAHPDHPATRQYAAAMASARFDYAEAEAQVAQLLAEHGESPRWQMFGEAELASYALIGGRLEEARDRALRAFDYQEEAGTRFHYGPKSQLDALLTATIRAHFLDDPGGAAFTLDAVLEDPEWIATPPEDRDYAEMATLFAASGRLDRARDRLAAFVAEVPEEERDDQDSKFGVRAAEAAIALAEGSPLESVRLLREARDLAPECKLCGLAELGEAFEAAALPDSAVAAYREYLDTPALFRSQFDNPRIHRVYLGLGRSHEALGEPDLASDCYSRLLALWDGADSALRPRIQAIRSKVSTLSRG